MKKIIYVAAAALSMMSMAACNGNQKASGDAQKAGDKLEIYTGVLPAADCDGIRYALQLKYDDDHNYTDGDYDLLETYLVSDSVGNRDDKSFKSEGDFSVMEKNGNKYLKLVQDRDDSQQGSADSPMYFLVESDSTIVMVNSDLQKSDAPGLNYTLKLSK
ncbi:MAG: copper resistance protein NlpE [Bacteroides sp.]|nr:copper resistance protein NlpE [Bacteroides sp.]